MGHRADESEDNDMKGVLPIAPHTLTDVFEIMLQIGNAASQDFAAERAVKLLRDRLRRVALKVAPGFDRRPRVVSLEACKPLISGGHWLPEMKMIAGGIDELQEPGAPAEALRWERVLEHQPDVLLINFEGSFEKTLEKVEVLASQPGWWNLNAVKNREVYVLNNKIFSRPGPRLVDGVEMLARIFHPDLIEEPLVEGMCLKLNLEAGKKVRPGRLRNFFSSFH
jgi:ABC-type Fe3+-hydroxamate transport system substrate-binding protein